MKLSLLVMTPGKQEGKAIEIKHPQFLIGRDQQCQLRPASALISKRHCAIIQRDEKVFIRDFGSTNGTSVNDEPVKGERQLKPDDVLKVGPILFQVKIELPAKVPVKAVAKADSKVEAKPTAAPQKQPAINATPAPATRPVNATPAPATRSAGSKTPATKAPTKNDTPIPAALTKPKNTEADDDIAAMLLSLEDGDSSVGEDKALMEGSTMHEISIPADLMAGAKPGAKPADKKPAPTGDTRSAAARILEKMTKRPRT